MLVLDPEAGEVTDSVTIKKSRFDATLAPVSSIDDALSLVEGARAENPGAGHACWGVVVGSGTQQVTRSSDDGEPGGTAGPPILAALTSRGVVNAVIVVVRYFGGIKLGAGGLVRAYNGSATAVLDKAPLRAARPVSVIRLAVPVADAGRVEKDLRALGSVRDVAYGAADVEFTVEVPAAAEAQVRDHLMSLTSGAATILDVTAALA